MSTSKPRRRTERSRAPLAPATAPLSSDLGEPAPANTPVVVGVGASAGGLEAIQELFDHLPPDIGAAFVVVQHLSPDFKSLMHEILRRHTQMEVVRVDDSAQLRPNHVYLLPARTNILVEGNLVRVESQTAGNLLPRPIDVFFDSLAGQCGQRGIAVVLSGTGSDGSRGAALVKEAGGIVLVQSPESAAFDGMPAAAIANGCADFILSPKEMAAKLVQLVAHPFLALRAEDDFGRLVPKGPYERILEMLRHQTGYDLTPYKPGTLIRRIERRMGLHHIGTAEDYVARLGRDPEEVGQLARDCFIHVTNFFRDTDAFRSLAQFLGIQFVKGHLREDPFRVWVAGCSTGEEVYSIAALIERLIAESGSRIDYKIFATDIDREAIDRASPGRYPRTAELDIPRQYFDLICRHDDEMLRIHQGVRNKIVFARHDVLRDPPFPRADLVVCRNLLIYLQPEAQQRILERFNFSLRREGILFLGPSEAVEPLGKDFKSLDAKWKIFTKVRESRLPLLVAPNSGGSPLLGGPARAAARPTFLDHSLLRACEYLVSLFASAGLIVSEAGEVLFTFGDVGRWLSLPRGLVTTNLRDLLPDDISHSVLLGLRQAHSMAGPVRIGRLVANSGEVGEDCALDLLHIPATDGQPGYDVLLLGREAAERVDAVPPADLTMDEMARRQIQVLEHELKSTRESLQTTIEELETSNEELQSVNEELLASNEELQSTNEELHSVNEELYTVNAEHQQRIEENTQITADLELLIDATQIGTVFVDETLHIRRFTQSAQLAIPLRAQDIGRSILELMNHLEDVNLADLTRAVLQDGTMVERAARTTQGTPLLVRVHPYTQAATHGGGAVITFVDMTGVEAAQQKVLEQAAILRRIAEASRDVFWMTEVDSLRVRYVSPVFASIWGVPVDALLQDPMLWIRSIHPDDRNRVEHEFLGKVRQGDYDVEYRIIRPDGQERWIHDRTYGAGTLEDGQIAIIGVAHDVTSRVQLERQRRRTVEMHRLACDRARVPMLLVMPDGKLLWSNRTARLALVGPQGEMPASLGELLPDAKQRERWNQAVARLVAAETPEASFPLEFKAGPGGRLSCDAELALVREAPDDPGFIVCQWVDLSDRLAAQRELETRAATLAQEADRDPLTNLLNRRGFERLLARQLALAGRTGDQSMIILVDCDRFKEINDQHGHAFGDRVLREIAQRMARSLRPSDLLARVGGDEFLAVLPATRLAEGAHVGEKLRRSIAGEPIGRNGDTVPITVSIGVVPAPPGAVSVEELVAAAGSVLRSSKLIGRDRVTFSSGEGDPAQMSPTVPVFDEILKGQVHVVAQSLNDVRSGRTVGYEFFCRGVDPLFRPEEFFEESRRVDCLEELDALCLGRCVRRAQQIPGSHRFHLNLFPSTLTSKFSGAVDDILERITRRDQFCLELSEQQFIGSSSEVCRKIDRLRSHGFKIALDDVGFGHSALETLLAVEPDVVKIDRSIVAEVDRNEGATRTLERMTSMLGRLNTELIAEGVERERQRQILERFGIRTAQGFLWSTPQPIGDDHEGWGNG